MSGDCLQDLLYTLFYMGLIAEEDVRDATVRKINGSSVPVQGA
jgi:hypothetical protein